nr:type II toxin-antitoxin system Phd/YefM family antitoxin [Roseovarius autotrophicus]
MPRSCPPILPEVPPVIIDVNSRQFRSHLRAYLDHVMMTGDRVLIHRHGTPVAALVCKQDFEALEEVSKHEAVLFDHVQQQQRDRFRLMKGKMRRRW